MTIPESAIKRLLAPYDTAMLNKAAQDAVSLVAPSLSIDEMLRELGTRPEKLAVAIQRGLEHYQDGALEWKQVNMHKLHYGTASDRNYVLHRLADIMTTMHSVIEPSVAGLRLLANLSLVQLMKASEHYSLPCDARELQDAVKYTGTSFLFEEQNKQAIPQGALAIPIGGRPSSVCEAVSQAATGFRQLKDILKEFGDATNPAVYERMIYTGDIPDVRLGEAFGAISRFGRIKRQLLDSYAFLAGATELSPEGRAYFQEARSMLKNADRRNMPSFFQAYADMQYDGNRLWRVSSWFSRASVAFSTLALAYTFKPFIDVAPAAQYADAIVTWAIADKVAVAFFTKTTPKILLAFRRFTERVYVDSVAEIAKQRGKGYAGAVRKFFQNI